MSWLILVLGSITGSVLSAMSRQNDDSFLLRLTSFAVPLATGGLFWYMQYKSGELFSSLGSKAASGITSAVISVIICMVISKLLGVFISKYIELKK